MIRRSLFPAVCTTLLLTVAGCGGSDRDLPELGQVSGTVKIDGKEMEDVVVTFAPVKSGRSSTGRTDSNGNYTLYYLADSPGAIPGKHNVFVSSYVDFDPNDPDGPMVPPAGNVPPDYANIEKQVDVKAGDNEIDLSYP